MINISQSLNNWFFLLIRKDFMSLEKRGRYGRPNRAMVQWGSKVMGPFYMAVGPFHCEKCAATVADFGLTEQGAYEFNHGTPDQKFFAMYGDT